MGTNYNRVRGIINIDYSIVVGNTSSLGSVVIDSKCRNHVEVSIPKCAEKQGNAVLGVAFKVVEGCLLFEHWANVEVKAEKRAIIESFLNMEN